MAYYGDKSNLHLSGNQKEKYEKLCSPGSKPPSPGIYRCQTCGFEDVINRECGILPPCSNCKKKGHNPNEHWKLIVTAADD